ncbi:helix-turn-helix domain-containing protein [Xylella fastidiosa subsp. multiplex]|uniref:Helix-turn-helix domain-containing protein n=1 Tax=Xylella fastidiosa subsp. multiplex TaxID=644357 RepID=A0A9Q4QRH8_XYLFS|nr:helix-turn-helix domain-containing protein [Xylella fastidiosa subsp. multiplex]
MASKYLITSGIKQAVFAEKIGATQAAVSRYAAGRLPEEPYLTAIYNATNRQVTANDFVGHKQRAVK